MKQDNLLFETETLLERPRVPTAMEVLLVPHRAALVRLNPMVSQIRKELTMDGVPDVVAWYLQMETERKLYSQKRRVEKLEKEYAYNAERLRLEAATKHLPINHPAKVIVYPSWIAGGDTSMGRASRRASIKQGALTRKAREQKHARVMADRAARGKPRKAPRAN